MKEMGRTYLRKQWSQSANNNPGSGCFKRGKTKNKLLLIYVLFLFLSLVAVQSACSQFTEAVSAYPDGSLVEMFAGTAGLKALNGDGRYALFYSLEDITSNSSNEGDLYLKDLTTGAVEAISAKSETKSSNGDSSVGSISSDGQLIAFETTASNLSTIDKNNYRDIYLRNRQTSTTTLLSAAEGGGDSDGSSYRPIISADGNFVVYESDATNLSSYDTNSFTDIYLYDLQSNTNTLISKDPYGPVGNGNSFNPWISGDGSYIVFQSVASNLSPSDSNNAMDIFLYDRVADDLSRISIALGGMESDGESVIPAISDDGNYIVFRSSTTNLVMGDTNGVDDIFLYNRIPRTIERISKGTAGQEANDMSDAPSISSDGRFITFTSWADNLVESDTNFSNDVFVYDRLNGSTSRVNLDSANNQSAASGWHPSISADGRYISWETSGAMVPEDLNGSYDVYRRDYWAGPTPPAVDSDNDGYTVSGGDCDDSNPAVNPGAVEVCNGIDDNCVGGIDEGVTTTFYLDGDSDNYGLDASTTQACSLPAGYAAVGGDCDDVDPAVNPGAVEVCNGIDDNCAGGIDEGVTTTFYLDGDSDNYGLDASTTQACSLPAGYAAVGGDCDDVDPAVNPGATEVCGNGIDDNCSGTIDLGCTTPLPENSFGKQYEDLVPADATVPEYDPDRFSIVTGLVEDRNGLPLEGVKATIHGLPEYGSATTDSQGRFSLPIDGGTTFTVVYEKQGFITSSRQVDVPWNGFAIAETIVMIGIDSQATLAVLDGNPQTITTHKSTEITDEFGSRSTTIVIAGDNRAWVPDGSGGEVELTQITMRATEFDVPESMPAKLPPTSAYTYCAELSIDEAPDVRFENPVVMYVDNFLGFDVGEIVPVGYFDREAAVWMPSDNGVVVKLLDTDVNGIVDALDATGDDIPDDLNGDGFFDDEVSGLSDSVQYVPNQTYWRSEINHFTPWDCNFPYGPPLNATPPNPPSPPTSKPQLTPPLPGRPVPCTLTNSYCTPLDQTFHEDIPIPGTGMSLHYSSSRTPGRKTIISIPASGDTVPASLKSIRVVLYISGRQLKVDLPAAPNQIAELLWDGLDVLGRPVFFEQEATVKIGFVYDLVYYSPNQFYQAWAQAGSNATAIRTRQEGIFWTDEVISVASPSQGVGAIAEGWTLSRHHQTAPGLDTLIKGDGSMAGETPPVTQSLVKEFDDPSDIAIDAAGNLFITERCNSTGTGSHPRVWKVDPSGNYTIAAGIGTHWYNGDEIPATQANLEVLRGIDVDSAGNLFFTSGARIRKVDSSGIIHTVAGTGVAGYNGDGIPATQANLLGTGIAVDAQGNIFIAEGYYNRVRKVDPSGIISTVAGTGAGGYNGDDMLAVEAKLNFPYSIAVDSIGNLFIADALNNRIRKVDAGGIITTVAGTGVGGYDGDGVLAINAQINHPVGVDVDPLGNLYISDSWNQRVRQVSSNGIITTVAGNGVVGPYVDGVLPKDTPLGGSINGLTVAPNGDLYVAVGLKVRAFSPKTGLPSFAQPGEKLFVDEPVAHVIDSNGWHRATVDLATGVELFTFDYNAQGQLTVITDKDGNSTVIQRDANGVPEAIVSPDNLVTTLAIDANSQLQMVTYPDASNYQFDYTPDGLMTDEWDPNGNHFIHGYDAVGGVASVSDPEGGYWTYAQTTDPNGTKYTTEQTGELNVASTEESTSSAGIFTQTTTTAYGSTSTFTRAADNLSAAMDTTCGMHIDYSYGIDPAFKNTILKGSTTQLPSGLTLATEVDRSYQDTDLDGTLDQKTEIVASNGNSWTTVNDSLTGTITYTTPTGRVSTATYDPMTLLPQGVSTPGLFPTTFGYDARGRLETVGVGTRTTTMAYDANGYPDYVVTPDNQTIDYNFDVMGRLRDEIRPDGTTVSYDYDNNGNITVLTTPKLINHLFGYTANDQSMSYATPLSGSYAYTYDKERNLKTITAPSGSVITNNYTDALLTSTVTPEGTITYGHDCGGKISSITKGAESIGYTYDASLLETDTRTGLINQTLSITYNNDFNLESFTYAGGTETYGYDLDGLLTSVGAFTITRNVSNGLPEAVGDGIVSLTNTINGYGELDANDWTVASNSVYSWNVSQRDQAGRIKQRIENIGGETITWDYDYDLLGRLVETRKNSGIVESYGYDDNGNRTSETNTLRGISGRTFSYSDEDHMMSAGTDVYEYDLDGYLYQKTTAEGVTGYDYSSTGELLQVDLPNGDVVSYDHDPLGRRIAKRLNGAIVEKYLWAGVNTHLLATYNSSDVLVSRFDYAGGRMPISMTAGGSAYYLAYDQVGSLRAVTDAAGSIIKRIDYDSYGNIISDSNPGFSVPFGFAGGLYDQETGLVRFGARDYDSTVGRWTAKDPLGFAAGDVSLFGYVLNDPVDFVDPEGLSATCSSSPSFGSCWKNCMSKYGANIALIALGAASPAMTIPKPFGAGVLGSGPWTTALSIANVWLTKFAGYGGRALRLLGQRLNPVSNVIAAGAGGYLVGLSGNCAFMCTFQTP